MQPFTLSHSQISRASSHQACSQRFIWTGDWLKAFCVTSLSRRCCEFTTTRLSALQKRLTWLTPPRKHRKKDADITEAHGSRGAALPDFICHLNTQRRHAEGWRMLGDVTPSAPLNLCLRLDGNLDLFVHVFLNTCLCLNVWWGLMFVVVCPCANLNL